MRLISLAVMLLPGPLQALDYCDELWFTRNLVFHQAGHCFGTPLGQAVFGNAECKAGGAVLEADALALVERARRAEASEDCAVDTNRTTLNIEMLHWRKRMTDPPFPSLFESSCIGWKGEPIELYAARDPASEPTGVAEEGDSLLFEFEDKAGWSFVEVVLEGEVVSVGWTDVTWSEDSCAFVAG
jgi:hypothetical protein